jgi:hypothetical protein
VISKSDSAAAAAADVARFAAQGCNYSDLFGCAVDLQTMNWTKGVRDETSLLLQ